MTSILQFSVQMRSRHPRNIPSAYSKVTHKYANDYVNPKKWDIQIVHTLYKEKEALKKQADNIVLQPNKPNFEVMARKKADLNNKVSAMEAVLNNHEIHFTIQTAGGFSKKTRKNDYAPVVDVPSVGTYTVTIIAKHRNGQTSSRGSNIIFQDILIVSLGDSYAAGEGNPDEPGKPDIYMKAYAEQGSAGTLKDIETDIKPITGDIPNVTPELEFAKWQEPLAHRSYLSGHSLAVERVDGKYSDLHVISTFLPLARSGAKSDEGLIKYNSAKFYNERRLRFVFSTKSNTVIKQRKEYTRRGSLDYQLEIGQIDEAKAAVKNKQIDFLILTIGGNDIKWSSNFSKLIEFDSEFKLFNVLPLSVNERGDQRGRDRLEAEIDKELAKISRKFEALNIKIRETLNPRFILLTEYPNGFFGTTNANGSVSLKSDCGIFKTIFDTDIDRKDAGLVLDLSIKLNAELKRAAERHNWIWVDGIAEEFGKHGYCDKNTYFISAERSFKTQGDWYGMLHLNERGNAHYARRISDKIKEVIKANLETFRPKPRIITGTGRPPARV